MERKNATTGAARRTPPWVWLIVLALGLIEPVSHWAIVRFPPKDAAPSGLHTVDTGACLTAMAHCRGDYFSPYARCSSEYGTRHPSLYALPHHHLYGAIGAVGRVLHIPPFHFLGLANGLALAFFLLASYALLRIAVPQLADSAFLLFSLGGGLGGVLYVLTAALGVHGHPLFPEYFYRYFIYELSEGPRFQPYLLAARLYYTVTLGLGWGAVAGTILAVRSERKWLIAPSGLALTLGGFLNFRVGPMVWAVAIAYLLCAREYAISRRGFAAAVLTLALASGMLPAAWMVGRNPEMILAVGRNARFAMWLSPFISATFFYWLIVPGSLFRALDRLPRLLRLGAFAALGYVAAYLVLYVLYQVYYGNFWRCLDFTVAVRMCDWALLGAPAGIAYALWRTAGTGEQTSESALSWAALWFLGFFALAFSAFGQGWFLRFTPDRFLVILGLPLAILGAEAIRPLSEKHPRLAITWVSTVVICGIISILVTWTVSYGPLGYRTAQRYYSWTRWAFLNAADARVLEHLPEGVVLAPSLGSPLFGDIAALRSGISTVYGNGTIDYSREVMPSVRSRVAEFFAPDTPDEERQNLVREWCVNHVYCPDTDPVDAAVVDQLRAAPWLRTIKSEGKAVLFEVLP